MTATTRDAKGGAPSGDIAAGPHAHSSQNLLALCFGALGIVFGDIGTSPLYALRECFAGENGIELSPANVLGVLSLIFWSLVLVICAKYLMFILRADNRGEGGILAMMALVRSGHSSAERGAGGLVLIGLFGAALLYGDGMITPAISVLSAVEGLHIATTAFDRNVVPITVVILVALFFFQSRGTERIGAVFAPITLVWFAVLAALGIAGIAREPHVLRALDPLHAVSFFTRNGGAGFLVLGAVFLVVTGGEALYADMGHFGRRPIQLAWFAIVLPALLLNYLGQGALLLSDPSAAKNPFYLLAPTWALYPLVGLATAATIIASQAVISGAFSLTRQAIQLGYCPRLSIRHTSEQTIGQIYVPLVNWVLMTATICLVLGFESSGNLADAYGIAVTTTMGITSVLFYFVARELWKWPAAAALALVALFLVVDLAFFGANIVKVAHGGWFPLLIATAVFTLMSTWKRGRLILAQRLRDGELPFAPFIEDVLANPPHRVPGTGIFMSAKRGGVPRTLLHNLKHNKILHQQIIILTVITEEIPYVPGAERVEVEELGAGMFRLVGRYGFMETPRIDDILAAADSAGLAIEPMRTTFFLGRETLRPTKRKGMAIWREHLFAFMSRNSVGATTFFGVPPNQVIEIGIQVEL